MDQAFTPLALALCVACAPLACRSKDSGKPGATASSAGPSAISPDKPAVPEFGRLPRPDFNRRAVELDQPLFWRSDANGNGALDPAELVVTWRPVPRERSAFVDAASAFTPEFRALYERLLRPEPEPGPAAQSDPELRRRAAVRRELAQGRPSLLETDFGEAERGEQELVRSLLEVARAIETLHAKQKGTHGLDAAIPPDDTASKALFFRNQGPFCQAAKTEKDPDCNALSSRPKPVFGLYPAELQRDPKFCERLGKAPNAAALMHHFSVVVDGKTPGTFASVPYPEAYREEMSFIAAKLRSGAAALGPSEAALKNYLEKTAESFLSNDWEIANRAWVAMTAENSKYYLRVAPDEVYYEPCAWKAGFALSFARINQRSLGWKNKLEPVKQELEDELARLAGKPYRARRVAFELPDFIDVVLNAGDSRSPLGATVGQSLPNWGAVAQQGGRTVAMTNLQDDPDSIESLQSATASLTCKATNAKVSMDRELSVLGTVLHEAAHNLGPSHDYKVGGKVDSAAFGGPLASTLEELKAQTAALYLPAWLVQRQLLRAADAEHAAIDDMIWALGQIAQGMFDSEGGPKSYSQLASIQLGSLQAAGALEWKPDELAANAQDRGCFELHFERWNDAVAALMRRVLEIKAQGDRAGAEQLVERWVTAKDAWSALRDTVSERWLRRPRASFAYSITW